MTSPLARAARTDQDIEPPYSVIEKAALALMREDYPDEFLEDGSLTEAGQIYWHKRGYYYVQCARAVLAAIREPSIEVVMAGANEVENGDGELHRRKWQAMIDAALSEKPE